MTNFKARDWCITVFSEDFNVENHEFKYLIYQVEKCPDTGREHKQVYVEFNSPRTLRSVAKEYYNAHVEKRSGTRDQARAYCMKEESRVAGPYEYGEWESPKEKYNMWEEMKEMINGGKTGNEIYEKYPGCYIRYYKAIENMVHKVKKESLLEKKKEKYTGVALQHWQEETIWLLSFQSDREVMWIYDNRGGEGKSFLANYLEIMHGAFLAGDGKVSDLAHYYNSEDLVVIDYSRTRSESVAYGFIEQLKDGRVFSGKYESTVKYNSNCKVLVLANFEPDRSAMSADRWHVFKLENGVLKYEAYPNSIHSNFN